ncbi:type II CRISPR RNA-guided endonuclease Cas9 [Pontibacter burrus]|uniref:CRISPR-associated endonuclease Cas9 n=1 Tax=Pontibacter burrus TaxID=2704466 RepID=A0A6B3LWE9_9BACT|nr:type II CRISPR RNA-guided endonuclease Cas9 [Pontibacter burrus]NEM99275.1 type II CRISPR RNA-guided endonuclease Cas9 [Pontibacter burrus]
MKTLGLDLGTNSIGWSVVDASQKVILGAGSHIFQEGVNIDAKSKAETPKNAKRREYRQKRRQLFRRKFRNNLLQKALKQASLMPASLEENDAYWQGCPYQLRKKALSEPLTAHEIGRVIFHLNQRRGFKSNRKSGSNEEGALYKGGNGKTGIDDTLADWQNGDFRTFGEYLASLDPHLQRLRNRYTLRSWYERELEEIWQVQQRYHPDKLTPELKKQLACPDFGIVFYQRPLKSQKHLVGKCTLEPQKPRVPVCHPDFEEFRMWQIINNLQVAGPGRFNELLDDEEKTKLVELFYTRDKIKISDIRKKLKLTEDYTFNYEEKEQFTGNETSIKLSKLFGKAAWDALPDEDKTLRTSKTEEKSISKLDVWHTLYFAQDQDWLQKYAAEKWGFTDEQLSKLSKTHLKEGYGSLSLNAIRKMLPLLRQGIKYDKAALQAGYHHSQISEYKTGLEKLETPKNLRNPIVQQALYELRTLVNQLIQQYGKFDIIRVELARDLKVSATKRADIRIEQFKNRARNDRYYQELVQQGVQRPSKNDIDKYLLWEECKKTCPYTGQAISFNDLFLHGRFDIEHILPYSRTLDDSIANKTLCEKGFNIKKGNQTPHECLSGDQANYMLVLERVQKHMPRKLARFKQEKLDEDFAQKQLNDTRYISKEARAYLKSICDRVDVTTGTATAPLRHFWGLNSILNEGRNKKTRDDHRHHAVDALVVALTTPGILRELSNWNKLDRSPQMHNFEMPWDTFYRDARTAIENILVSQKKNGKTVTSWNRKVKDKDGKTTTQRQVAARGQLHKETVYGKRQDLQGKEFYAVRKSLETLTPAMIGKIVDPVVREIVKDRLRAFGVDPDSKKFEIPKTAFNEPLYMPNIKGKSGRQNQIKKVRIRENSSGMVKLKQDINQWVEPGSNHHVAIYQDEQGKLHERVVTFYEAVERKKQGIPVVQPTTVEGYTLAQTLQINDMFLLGLTEEDINWHGPNLHRLLNPYLYRVQKLSSGDYSFRLHIASTIEHSAEEIRIRSMKAWEQQNPIKVQITPTGQLKKL